LFHTGLEGEKIDFATPKLRLTYHLLSTGCDPIINGAIGSLYIADVPSIVTDTFMPKDRGTGKEKGYLQRNTNYGTHNIKIKFRCIHSKEHQIRNYRKAGYSNFTNILKTLDKVFSCNIVKDIPLFSCKMIGDTVLSSSRSEGEA
jgi:hypothetical protein